MMKQTKMLLLFFLSTAYFSYAYNNYESEIIGSIKNGKKPDEIRITVPDGGVGHRNPTYFIIDQNNDIIVCDDVAKKIIFFSNKLKKMRDISNTDYNIGYSSFMKNDENNNFYSLGMQYLFKFDRDGKIIYKIDKNSLDRRLSMNKEFYPYMDYLIYYNENQLIVQGNPHSPPQRAPG